VVNTEAEHRIEAQHGFMTFVQFLTVSAAAVGLVILAVMAAIPFLTDEPLITTSRDRSGSGRVTDRRAGRHVASLPAGSPRGGSG
jgi:hypothetical protein